MSEQATGKVFEAWAGVCEDMARGGIGKNRTGNGYKFRGIDDVLLALSSSFVAHKLAVRAQYTDHVVVPHAPKGFDARCTAEYHLHSLADGSSVGPFRFIAEAYDVGDKATNKVMSIAYKYFAIQTFAIPTEGVLADEEPNEPQERAPQREQPKADEPRITAGPAKGKRFSEAADDDLRAFGENVIKVVDNPATDMGTRDRGVALLRAIDAELAGRK